MSLGCHSSRFHSFQVRSLHVAVAADLFARRQAGRIDDGHVVVGEAVRIAHRPGDHAFRIVVVRGCPDLAHGPLLLLDLVLDRTGEAFMRCRLRIVGLGAAQAVVVHHDGAADRHPEVVPLVVPAQVVRRLQQFLLLRALPVAVVAGNPSDLARRLVDLDDRILVAERDDHAVVGGGWIGPPPGP